MSSNTNYSSTASKNPEELLLEASELCLKMKEDGSQWILCNIKSITDVGNKKK